MTFKTLKQSGRREPRQRRARQTVDAILEAVVKIVKRSGIKAVTTNRVAKVAGVERESLYRALSANGNPRLSTLYAVAKAVGLRLTLEAA